MTKYREIIRLKSLNFSERNIALSKHNNQQSSKVFRNALIKKNYTEYSEKLTATLWYA
ncbi:hypothetical protein HNQ56_002548 [Anaerotaenia torta]